jgi:hypothetical protein
MKNIILVILVFTFQNGFSVNLLSNISNSNQQSFSNDYLILEDSSIVYGTIEEEYNIITSGSWFKLDNGKKIKQREVLWYKKSGGEYFRVKKNGKNCFAKLCLIGKINVYEQNVIVRSRNPNSDGRRQTFYYLQKNNGEITFATKKVLSNYTKDMPQLSKEINYNYKSTFSSLWYFSFAFLFLAIALLAVLAMLDEYSNNQLYIFLGSIVAATPLIYLSSKSNDKSSHKTLIELITEYNTNNN